LRRFVDALDEAFYATFKNVEPSNKPVLLALDVSGSMGQSWTAGSCISAPEGSAAMALITAATEPECQIIAFSAVSVVSEACMVVANRASPVWPAPATNSGRGAICLPLTLPLAVISRGL
jgi:hypothetical protein